MDMCLTTTLWFISLHSNSKKNALRWSMHDGFRTWICCYFNKKQATDKEGFGFFYSTTDIMWKIKTIRPTLILFLLVGGKNMKSYSNRFNACGDISIQNTTFVSLCQMSKYQGITGVSSTTTFMVPLKAWRSNPSCQSVKPKIKHKWKI